MLGLVLPSNSPGVHTLWMPIIPMQVGLVLKPGPQEPWTPYRMAAAFFEAGIPKEAISIYPGGADVGAAVLDSCDRSLIFGGTPTVDRYRGNPRVQAHGPGFSKILLGDDEVDNWERYLDVMVESVFVNSGRGCINCSAIWASRHTREIADAHRSTPRRRCGRSPPNDPEASLAAFTVPGVADAISQAIDADLKTPGVTDMTAAHRDGGRVVKQGSADYLLPTVLHSVAPDAPVVAKEYMFPFVTVVECPESRMIDAIGPTLVCTAITVPRVVRAAIARRGPHRPAQHRSGPDDAAQLAAAARREHRRVPVPRPCVSGGADRRRATEAQRHRDNIQLSFLCDPVSLWPVWASHREAMRILSITAGAAGMYCGSCTRDNALARELTARGHDVTLLPVYTPTRPDEPNVSRDRVLFGGISVYLQQHASLFRRTPRLLDRLWDSPRVIRAFASRAISTDARMLGDLTISMLQGEQGVLRKEFDKLVDWMRDEPVPDVIELPNTLLIALAAPLKRAFDRPVCCAMQGEELFLDGLVPPYRERALALIRRQVPSIDRFVAVGDYCAAFMSKYIDIPPARISVVPLGISMEGYAPRLPPIRRRRQGNRSASATSPASRPRRGCTCSPRPTSDCDVGRAESPMRLEAAGYLARSSQPYLDDVRRILARAQPGSRVRLQRRSRSRREAGVSQGGSTCSPCRRSTTSPRACSCSRRWRAGCPSCSRGEGDSPRSSNGRAEDCWSARTIPTRSPTGFTRSSATALCVPAWRHARSTAYARTIPSSQSAARLLDVYASLRPHRPADQSVA